LAQEAHVRAEHSYERWNKAWAKYNYYVVGIAAGLLAYLAKDYHLVANSIASRLLLLAIVLLLGSVGCGLKQIESTIHGLNLQSYRRQLQHKIVQAELIRQRATDHENASTGGVITPAMAEEGKVALQGQVEAVTKKIREESDVGGRFYRWRDWTLMAALVALVAARLF
jgi:hypothetical protein